MKPHAVQPGRLDPAACYVNPIRSVLVIDDRFPVYGTPEKEDHEGDRARSLWSYCARKGWLCDIDDGSSWGEGLNKRMENCDLLILDYHLEGEDFRKALRVIDQLSASPAPCIVLLYTADTGLDEVLTRAAIAAYGDPDEDEDGDERLDNFGWSHSDIVSYLLGTETWYASVQEHFATVGDSEPPSLDMARYSIANWVRERRNFGGEPCPPRRLTSCSTAVSPGSRRRTQRWFQAGNLFLCVVGKPKLGDGAEDEADLLIKSLECAVNEWSPPWIACMMSYSRRLGEQGAFFDDQFRLPEADLMEGLLEYIRGNSGGDDDDSFRCAREIAHHLLYFRFSGVSEHVARFLVQRACETKTVNVSKENKLTRRLHLNAFLCSRPFDSPHVTLGTVLKSDGSSGKPEYLLVVSPSCDMVPRAPSPDRDPWAHHLDPIRPTLVIELRPAGPGSAVNQSVHGQHVFFIDSGKPLPMEWAASGNTSCPRVHMMFLRNRGKLEGNSVRGIRVTRPEDSDEPTMAEYEGVPVAQLRAPYAERIAQSVGAHLSRIGVDFFSPKGE